MSTEDRIQRLEQEFQKWERDSIEKLITLQVQMVNISAQLQTFVSQHQFAPVKLIAYGLAGGVLLTVLGAILAKSLGI
jgi:hypothetical protein